MSLEEALYRAYLATALFGIIGFCIYFYTFINDYLNDKLTFKNALIELRDGLGYILVKSFLILASLVAVFLISHYVFGVFSG